MSDGTVIHAGTDINKYFTFNLDRNNGKVVISANKDFLNIINDDVNRKNEIKWNAYFQVKRIATGENITNIAEESYNDQIVKTNKVFTNTPKPVTPAPNCPTTITPVLPNCPTPIPVKQTTPGRVQPSVKKAVKEAVQRNLSQPDAPSVKITVQQVVSTMDKKQEVKSGLLPQTGQNENNSDKSIGILLLITGILGSLGLVGHRKKEVN
ncbi:LPXTG cell wall anchor domain-containing protein [Fructilactobacillus ixorae]|uniref:LPXTG cell wall anchor domain-containing protein n=1 Tax=Fructilactobacillus ixorae TaxID=1750535 RepID=A0ABY5C5V4_9LACO|nr:LPXTG cell wall anchor domain-containing protein [Fructilactobacillus ixorae]